MVSRGREACYLAVALPELRAVSVALRVVQVRQVG